MNRPSPIANEGEHKTQFKQGFLEYILECQTGYISVSYTLLD